MLKKILGGVAVLIGVILVTALILPDTYKVQREVEIHAPLDATFDYVLHLRNQDNFSVWAQRDPNMEKHYEGTDATVGFTSFWNSQVEEVGVGEQEITKIENGKRVEFELRFTKPFEAKDMAYFETELVDAGTTKVVWGFEGRMPYPSNLMLLFMNFDDILGPDLANGLANLKVELENK
tara:strand:- start:28287 stop:28823 length:537 start_codon:yes stop_codon:yes gene_type:complete